MCRIAGVINPQETVQNLETEVNSIIDSMIHGGPDGRGVYSHSLFAFGHCRLSIIDLSTTSNQPMSLENSEFVITYNGEIYNYHELKQELIKDNYSFKTNSDTEVILVAFKAWGIKCFERLNGMFAFSLYDKSNNVIYLVRDGYGIKPLYYYSDSTKFIFSSELHYFKKNRYQENNYWRVLLLSYGFLPEPYTKYHNIFELPKSSFLEYSLSSHTYKVHKYEYTSHTDPSTTKIAIDQAIQRNLIADASIGTFLSGGIDSSIISIVASKNHHNIDTVSMYFNEEKYSEKKFQDIVSSRINSKHHPYLLDRKNFDDNIEKVFNTYYSPSNDGVNTWFISKFAKDAGLKTVLAGIGADELFGGYPSFKRLENLKTLRKYKGLLKHVPKLISKYNRFGFLELEEECADYLILRGFYSPEETASILNIPVEEVLDILNSKKPYASKKLQSLVDVSEMEINIYMLSQLLKDTDAMSMQHGLEIRVPFLDFELKSSINKLNIKDRFSINSKKKVLIDCYRNSIPEEVLIRPKSGFVLPFQEWFKNSDFIRHMLYEQKLNSEFEKFSSNQLHWSKLWILCQLEI